MFCIVGAIFCTLGVILELIFGPCRHPGVTFGALRMHFSHKETDLGAEAGPGAPQGAHPRDKLTHLDTFLELMG